MNRYNRTRALSSARAKGTFQSKKTIKGIAKLWADDDKEINVLCSIGGRIAAEYKDYTYIRSHFVEREIIKCVNYGLIEDGERLMAMLTSEDREMSKLGMEIVYELREKRLHGQK